MEDVRLALAELPTRADREPVVGAGEGGDETTAIDAAAERAIVRRFEQSGIDGVLVSEEVGEVRLGAGGAMHVVLDPIDGSLNAKRGIGFFSVSIAFASGERMGDVDTAEVAIWYGAGDLRVVTETGIRGNLFAEVLPDQLEDFYAAGNVILADGREQLTIRAVS